MPNKYKQDRSVGDEKTFDLRKSEKGKRAISEEFAASSQNGILAYLIDRPIAVLLSFFVLALVGILAGSRLPIGLLPESGIPRFSVQVSYPNASAQTIEASVLAPLRNQLLQISELQDLRSVSRDESGLIYLDFPFGTDTELAFIELNEQIDQATNYLPRDLPRPRVVAGDLSDMPVVQLAVTLREPPGDVLPVNRLLRLSEWSRKVLKRRLEQIPQVAFADLSGTLEPMIRVSPQHDRLRALSLTEADLSAAIAAANLPLGQMLIKDGHYLYNTGLANRLQSAEQVADLWLRLGERNIQLHEVAEVELTSIPARGYYERNGQAGVVFNLHKRAEASLFKLQENLDTLLVELRSARSKLDFDLDRDQTRLLRVSIRSLLGSLSYGAGFAVLMLFAFFREWRRPLLIAIAVPVALLLALLGFYLLGLSINLISLAGLILGLGLMIDNSIIVLDNIRQFRRSGLAKRAAAVQGGEEIIRPLLASALTTIAVFMPLLFLSGLAGALFYDQALAVSLALGASLLVAYFLLPHLGVLVDREVSWDENAIANNRWLRSGVDLVLNRPIPVFLGGLVFLAGGYWCYSQLPKSSFPELSRTEYRLEIDWGEPIGLRENLARSRDIAHTWQALFGGEAATQVGERQFALEAELQSLQAAVLSLYLPKARGRSDFAEDWLMELRNTYPYAQFKFLPEVNPFDRAFLNNEPYLEWRLRRRENSLTPEWETVESCLIILNERGHRFEIPTRQQTSALTIDHAALARTKVSLPVLEQRLLGLFNQNELTRLQTNDRDLAVILSSAEAIDRGELLAAAVINDDGYEIPLATLVSLNRQQDYETLTADRRGEYFPLTFREVLSRSEVKDIEHIIKANTDYLDSDYRGRLLTDRARLRELSLVLLVSLGLLYLILAVQFESLRLPLVVLMTVPFSLIGGLWAVYLTGQSLNLVVMIGLVVTGGIVVNDAIIKVDMIERARRAGANMHHAIHVAGLRRLAAILMTSLTTILALLPILFGSGLGAELQSPLAIAVIGGLAVGTLASLFLVPLFYRLIAGKGRRNF